MIPISLHMPGWTPSVNGNTYRGAVESLHNLCSLLDGHCPIQSNVKVSIHEEKYDDIKPSKGWMVILWFMAKNFR